MCMNLIEFVQNCSCEICVLDRIGPFTMPVKAVILLGAHVAAAR